MNIRLPACAQLLMFCFMLSLGADALADTGANCRDPWVTAALKSLGKGSSADNGNNGLCNTSRYRGGSWGSQPELNDLVRQSFLCNDPWIGQVYAEAAMGYSKPNGSGTGGECNPSNYGGGSWSSFADLRAKVKTYKTPVAAPSREPMIRAAYFDAFGRQPLGDELKYWMGFPANDPSMASQTALFNAHLTYLKQNVAEQRETVKRALDIVFKNEQVNRPQLQVYLDDNNKDPVKFAINDMLAGREGGGYRGLLAWLSKTETRNYYLQNAGIQAAMAPPPPVVVAPPVNLCADNTSALYAFDGTETNETHKSAIWQVQTRFQGINNCSWIARYIKGPNMQGSDSWPLFQAMFNDACKDVQDKGIKKVFVIGFSRGAINAIRFANEFPNCSRGMTVAFLGVSDPVDALMMGYDIGKSLQPGKAAKNYKVTKIKNDMSLNPLEIVNNNFYTAATPGFARTEQVSNREQTSNMGNADRHWMMNASGCASGRDVESRYIREMMAMGVRFKEQQAPGFEPCKM